MSQISMIGTQGERYNNEIDHVHDWNTQRNYNIDIRHLVYQELRAPNSCERGRPFLQPRSRFSKAAMLKRQARTTIRTERIRRCLQAHISVSETERCSSIRSFIFMSACFALREAKVLPVPYPGSCWSALTAASRAKERNCFTSVLPM